MGRQKKMKGILTDGGEDRISSLPESLIHHILSFLLMRDVIRTCLLSRQWRNIWKKAPVLNFEQMVPDNPGDNEFIDQSLIHYEGRKIKKLRLYFDCRDDNYIDASHLESRVHFAAMRGVEELDLSAGIYEGTLPSSLFKCLEMRVLKFNLAYCSPHPFHFPVLTELHITDLMWNYLDTSACPLLKVLIIYWTCDYDSVEIYAPNPILRFLDITEADSDYGDNNRLTLYAPNVLHFEFTGSFARFYEFKDISSVQTLNLYSSRDPIGYINRISPRGTNEYRMALSLVELLRNFTHVKSLKLCPWCIQILAYGEMVGLKIPSLDATCLELVTILSKFVLVGITSLLKASRCIEQLIINMEDSNLPTSGWIFKDHDIKPVKAWESLEHALSVKLALNTILLQNYPGYSRSRFTRQMEPNIENYHFEVKLVEVLLKGCKMLNKMNISIMKPPTMPWKSKILYGLTKKLLVFPRASVNAEVYFS